MFCPMADLVLGILRPEEASQRIFKRASISTVSDRGLVFGLGFRQKALLPK